MLRERGLDLQRAIALPDHFDFREPPDLSGEIVCTEKDAVKLWRTHPQAWAVPLEVEIGDAFWSALDAKFAAMRVS